MIVRMQLQDSNGQPLEGIAVLLTGCGQEPSITGQNGQVQFLTDDDIATVTVTINDSPAWTGPSSELRKMEVFEQSDSGFARK